jgi:TatA/E family protein of Tat protein translocase
MEIFGFSAAKIITILIIAIIIFGPDKVPEMARTVGRTIRDVRRYMNAMTAEFNEATGDLREEFTGIAQDLRGELDATQADLRRQLDLTGIFNEAAATVAEPPASAPIVAAAPITGLAASQLLHDEAEPPPAAPMSERPIAVAMPEAIKPVSSNGKRVAVRATKADPYADLAVLAVHDPRRDAAQGIVASAHARRVIGHSVSGTAYLRRRGATPVSCRGICRSARVHHETDNCVATAAPTPISAAVQ